VEPADERMPTTRAPVRRPPQERQAPHERGVGWALLPAARADRPAFLSAGGSVRHNVECPDRAPTPTHRIRFRRGVDLESPTGVRTCTDASRHERADVEHSCGRPLPATAGSNDALCRRFRECAFTQVSETIESPKRSSCLRRLRFLPPTRQHSHGFESSQRPVQGALGDQSFSVVAISK
jgi:hypothetical protein